jgi:hypothetical protein
MDIEKKRGAGSDERLDEFVEWDCVPSWNAKKKRV